jgi:hypothetical protein
MKIVSQRKSFVGHLLVFSTFCQFSTELTEAAPLVECESFNMHSWSDIGLKYKACSMKHRTVIETRGYIIDSPFNASNIKAFSAYNNKKIHFLPSNISDSFPEIIVFNVADCSIRGIFKENFRNLTFMEYLWLAHNKISVIPSDKAAQLVYEYHD